MSKKITILGDVHQNFKFLYNSIEKYKDSDMIIQVGDIELGFPNCPKLKKLPDNFGLIQGNHDNLEVCKKYKSFLGEFGFKPEYNLFYIGGAETPINEYTAKRFVPGYDWWFNEELNSEQLKTAYNWYCSLKPDIVVSHTCPASIAKILYPEFSNDTRTHFWLEKMLTFHSPKEWTFGHYHTSFQQVINKTKFVCVNKCEVYNIII
jgi:hypothetical protein